MSQVQSSSICLRGRVFIRRLKEMKLDTTAGQVELCERKVGDFAIAILDGV